MIALHASIPEVVGRGYADRHAERPKGHRHDRAAAGTQARIGGRDRHKQQNRKQPADKMIARGGAGRWLHEVLVEQVRCDHGDAHHHKRGLAPPGGASVTRGERLRP